MLINPIVRERCAFACDIGSPRTALAEDWPEWDFSHLDEIWWPSITESEESIEQRAALFREEMTALDDWADTLVVTHWGFILSMSRDQGAERRVAAGGSVHTGAAADPLEDYETSRSPVRRRSIARLSVASD